MRRRDTMVLAVLGLLSLFSTTPAAQTPTVGDGKRIGWLSTDQPSPALASYRDALRQALVGHVNLQRVAFEERHVGNRLEQLRAAAAELARLKVNAFLAVGHEAGRAALQATNSIPIVVLASDPVAAGLVKSLDDPGANVTGVAFDAAELSHRRVQILKELVPKLSTLAVLGPGGSGTVEVQAITAAAKGLGIEARPLDADNVRTLGLALLATGPGKLDGLLVPVEPWLVADARAVVELTVKHRLPAVYAFAEFTDEGGLVAYGPNLHAMYRRAGSYLGRVVNGVRPRELPVERPSRAELVVNLRAARALGLTVPRSLLGAADRILE